MKNKSMHFFLKKQLFLTFFYAKFAKIGISTQTKQQFWSKLFTTADSFYIIIAIFSKSSALVV